MKTTKNKSKIILVFIVAIVATMSVYFAFQKQERVLNQQKSFIEMMGNQNASKKQTRETYAYAIATRDLKAGEPVSDEDVDFKSISVENPDAYDNRNAIINKVLLRDISANELFTSEHIAKVSQDMQIRPGYRALTFPAQNFAGKTSSMTPGSYVDIYTAGKNAWEIEGIKILALENDEAIGNGANSLEKKPQVNIMSAKSITFEIPADDIADFISNGSKNKMVLVARNSSEVIKPKKKPVISDYSSPTTLPTLPKSSGYSDSTSGIPNLESLPEPEVPETPKQEVEVIEANVKTKVSF